MSYIALYRKWRPSVFEDVVEQEHVVKTLRYSVSTGRIAHAYLFCGTRGTGKTTMAHIMSRAINCLNPINGDPCNQCDICKEILSGNSMDVIEIDAASNNSVDNVREIRDEVIYAPSNAKYKVYIIDEVHMLSSGAFNALLKTLEEPPQHVVFILATTEAHKLPATILSRCQRFDFRRITIDSVIKRLEEITDSNNITLDKDAAKLIAKMSDGALRDAISLLDQCISLGSPTISYNDVLSIVGIVKDSFITSIVDSILDKDVDSIIDKVNTLVMDGKDIPNFISDLILYYRNLLLCNVTSSPEEILDLPNDLLDIMKAQSQNISQPEIISIIKELSALEANLKWATNPRIMLEITLIKLCEKSTSNVDQSILERLTALEKRMEGGKIDTIKPISINQNDNISISKPVNNRPNINDKPNKTVHPTNSNANYLECWKDVLEQIKSIGRRTLHSFLLDTKAIMLDNDIIGIVFNAKNQFNKTILSKAENIEVVEETASKVIGHQVKIKCIDEDISEIPNKIQTEKTDDFVEKARNIAEKAGVPFNIIEE